MITYMDKIVGTIMDKVVEHGIDNNTLVIFTGDNGTHRKITSRLPGIKLKGGKGTMTEAGTRVPFICWWPGTIPIGERGDLLCLNDVLPTIASIAGIPVEEEVDGMDLSHNLLNKKGMNRRHVLMAYKNGFFIRTKHFRLHEDGTFYDIPVSSLRERYSEKVSENTEHTGIRIKMQKELDAFMAITPTYTPSLRK